MNPTQVIIGMTLAHLYKNHTSFTLFKMSSSGHVWWQSALEMFPCPECWTIFILSRELLIISGIWENMFSSLNRGTNGFPMAIKMVDRSFVHSQNKQGLPWFYIFFEEKNWRTYEKRVYPKAFKLRTYTTRIRYSSGFENTTKFLWVDSFYFERVFLFVCWWVSPPECQWG